MDGLNHAFKVNPRYFMQHNVLTLNPSRVGAAADPRELMTGLQHFDIRPLDYPDAAELKFFLDAGQGQHVGTPVRGQGARDHTLAPGVRNVGMIWSAASASAPPPREAPIRGYWLPYAADKTYEIELGGAANYFFTAGLSGCCVVVTGDPTAPRVAHVNRTEAGGDAFKASVSGPMAAEERLAKQHARMHGQSFESRVSKEVQTNRQIMFQELKTAVAARAAARDTSGDVLGYCKWGEPYNDLAGVIGVRNQVTGVWKFYYQRYRNVAAPPALAHLGFLMQRDGPLNDLA